MGIGSYLIDYFRTGFHRQRSNLDNMQDLKKTICKKNS